LKANHNLIGDVQEADILIMSSLNNSIKIHDWALKLWNKEQIEIDEVGYIDKFVAMVDNDIQLSVLSNQRCS